MRRFGYQQLFALFCLCFSTALHAQTGPSRVSFIGSHIYDSGGFNLLQSGKICAVTTDAHGVPQGYTLGAEGGQTSASTSNAGCANVVNGAIAGQFYVIDSYTSKQSNACVRITTFDTSKDPSGVEIRRSKCVQPGVPASMGVWCSTDSDGFHVTCVWDYYPVGTAPNPVIQMGQAGASAYAIAQGLGYGGTITQWLASLVGPQGPPGCMMGQNCTAALQPQSVGGFIYATGYGAQCNGFTDDTTTLQAALSAAKSYNVGGTLNQLILSPGTCRTNTTLNYSGVALIGAGGKIGLTRLQPTGSNPTYDILASKGSSILRGIWVNGGATTATGSNCVSFGAGQPGYEETLEDVNLDSCGNDGLRIEDGAYITLHDFKSGPVQNHHVEVVSGQTAGYQTTTVNFSGQVHLDVSTNGYGLYINNGVSLSLGESVTTFEGNKGIRVVGNIKRDLDFSHAYFENIPVGKCIDLSGSSGGGLFLSAVYGLQCVGPTPDDLAAWGGVLIGGNSLTGTPAFNSGMATVLRAQNGVAIGPQMFRVAIDTSLGTSFTPLSIVTLPVGHAWRADFDGVILDGSTHPSIPRIHINNAAPSFPTGGNTVTCSINGSGQFGCQTASGGAAISGELTVIVDKQYSVNSATDYYSWAWSGTCPTGHNLVVSGGLVTGCQ